MSISTANKEEMVKEHAREARELEAAAVDRKKIRFEAFKERLESVDLVYCYRER